MSLSTVSDVSESHPSNVLSGALIDAITDAVVWTPDPVARARVICSLIREMYEIAAGLSSSDPSCSSLADLCQVLSAAEEHQQRIVTHATKLSV